jgi:hypothetical protein
MPQLTGFSPWMPCFAPTLICVGFLMDKVALGQVFFLSSSVFPCHFHSTAAAPYSFTYHLGDGQ